MASTYSSRIRLVEQATGEGLNVWGTTLNSGAIQLTDDAIAGFVSVDMTGGTTVTLTTNQGATDQDRMAMVHMHGILTSSISLVFSSVAKTRWIRNATTGAFTITAKCLGGTGVVVPQGTVGMILCDAVSVFPGTNFVSTNVGTVALLSAAQTFTATNTFASVVEVSGAATFHVTTNVSGVNLTGPAFSGYVQLADAASIAVNMSQGINFVVTLAGNRTLEAPTLDQPGQSGSIIVAQDSTGSRTLSCASAWKFPGGNAPVFSTSASALDILSYQVYTSGFIFAVLNKTFS